MLVATTSRSTVVIVQYILDKNKHNHNSKGAPATGGQLYIHDFLDYDSIVQVHEWYNYSKQLNFVAFSCNPTDSFGA